MNKKLLLIDGSSMLSTNFFGTVPRDYYDKRPGMREKALEKIMKSADGQYTNGAYGFTKMLLKIFKQQAPTHVVIAWDISRDTFRKQIDPNYKGTRKETADELKSQFGLMQDVIEKMGLASNQYKAAGFEADDIIGTFAHQFKEDISVVIMTKDQDALQLIDEKVRVWLNTSNAEKLIKELHGDIPKDSYNAPNNFFEYTPTTFEEVYEIKPIQMIDKKALEGDTSDNIPGIKGVGEKAVLPLLKEFGTLEAIYEFLDSHNEVEAKAFMKEIGIGRPPYKNLVEGRDVAFMSKKLATIKCDMDHFAHVTLDDLLITINEESMNAKFTELQFNSLLK